MSNSVYPPKTVVIGTFSSYCADCGKSCNPNSRTHDVILGYMENGSSGCGVAWENVTSEYIGPDVVAAVRAMRPDLNYLFGEEAVFRSSE